MDGAASSVTHLVLTCNIILFTLLLLLLCVATCIVSVCATIFQILHSIRKLRSSPNEYISGKLTAFAIHFHI